jgi:hypothetical protein
MDGISSSIKKFPVIILGGNSFKLIQFYTQHVLVTDVIDQIDAAVLRPGRIDELIETVLPSEEVCLLFNTFATLTLILMLKRIAIIFLKAIHPKCLIMYQMPSFVNLLA